MPDTTPERDKAEALQRRYSAAAKAIRENPDLTEQARRRLIAQEWKSTRAQLDHLQSQEQTRLAKREQELERKLFGTSRLDGASEAISTRDAQDRAARVTGPQEAAALLHRAEQHGDQTLARAVAHHALQQSRTAPTRQAVEAWEGVCGSFLQARPQTTPVVEELALIERLGSRRVFSPFSLSQPSDVLPQDINSADPGDVRFDLGMRTSA